MEDIQRQKKANKKRDELIGNTIINFKHDLKEIAEQYSNDKEDQKFYVESAIRRLKESHEWSLS